jgi:hypothetical protein
MRTLSWIREFTDQNVVDELTERAMREVGELAELESESGHSGQ